jgi:hypothetical protein
MLAQRIPGAKLDVTSAQEYAGYLYLGSLHADRIGKLKVGE